MLREVSAVLLLSAFAAGLTAAPPDPEVAPAKGTRAFAVAIDKDVKLPEGVLPGALVDLVAQETEPVKTSIAVQGLKVLAVDTARPEQKTITVQVTPLQAQVLDLIGKTHKLALVVRHKVMPRP
jgi:Flp pilus assembly protein CpaB